MLEVSHLYKSYSGREVITDLNFHAAKGTVCGFLGPNGAGKSTTMNMLTGYLRPDKGEILINGISILKEPLKARRHIGYLPEQPPLYPDMTVEEYLGYVAELKGLKGVYRKNEVDRVVGITDLKEVRRRLIRSLSKGYRQRVGLAQAITADPELLILDEPSSGLDPRQNVEMRELIRRLGQDHTVILSTHILSEVSEICGHIMVLAGGQLKADSDMDRLLLKYNDRQRLRLVLKGNATTAEKDVKRIEDIEKVRVIKEDAESTVLALEAAEGCDVRERLVSMCGNRGFTLLELADDGVSIEEVYLKLTTEAV